IPKELARITGRTVTNPARFRERPDPSSGPLGDAPSWMTSEQRAVWTQFSVECPWLRRSDRALVEIASVLRTKLVHGEVLAVGAMTQLRLCLLAMGGSPCDRSRISAGEELQIEPRANAYLS